MRNRNPALVLVFTIITFFIYGIYWMVSTKNEMNEQGASIPTAWLIIVPIVSIWWQWKYCTGVEQVSKGRLGGAVAFLLILFLGPIGMAIIQSTFNQTSAG